MNPDQSYQTYLTAQKNLQRLGIIRGVALLGQWLALFFFSYIQPIDLPVSALTTVLSIYTAITAATWLRGRTRVPVADREFCVHLLIDIFFFSVLLYFSGGASNPFVSYYLIPISIAAITLPQRLNLFIALAALSSYTLLLTQYLPLAAIAPLDTAAITANHQGAVHATGHSSSANLHILGMWANFAISALIISYFIRRMASTVKRQQQKIAEQREIQLRDEQLLAVGTLAAGTAHELGSPLNTMKLIVDELVADSARPNADLTLLQQQIKRCKNTLKKLLMTAEESQSSSSVAVPVEQYFTDLVERWQIMRPDLRVSISLQANQRLAVFHPTVEQSLINLLDNAAAASPEVIDLDISYSGDMANITIRDYGSGLNGRTMDELGQAFVSHKAEGLGLGLFLSQATLSRFGGSVCLGNAPGGGAMTQITLPLRLNSETVPTEPAA